MIGLDAIIGVSGAVFGGLALIFTGMSYRQNTESRYMQVLMDLANDITLLENSQERNTDYDSFGAKYLNLHDEIALLAQKKIIPNDLAKYFDSHFAAALALLEKEEFKKYQHEVNDLIFWCKKQGIKPSTAPEPYRIAEVNKQSETNQDMPDMIRLDDDVHEDLTNLGAKNESYSKIIRRLINHYKQSIKK